MDVTVRWIDVTQALAEGRQPHVLIRRPQLGGEDRPANAGIYSVARVAHTGEFWVPAGPANAPEIEWSMTRKGELVRVPVNAYATPQRAKALLVAAGLEMGVRAGYDLARRCDRPPEELTVVLGSRVDPAGGGRDGYRYYLGLAFRVAESRR